MRKIATNIKQVDATHDLNVEATSQGRYSDEVRIVYQELVCKYGVSIRNFEGVVRSVIEGLTKAQVGKLPKKDFASYMCMYEEGRDTSQIQVLDTLLDENQCNFTLGGDGNTKAGHHYGAFDIHTEEGDCYVLGVRESAGGGGGGGDRRKNNRSNEKNVLDDLSSVLGDGTESVNTIIQNIKNTISDRHIAQKKFNKILQQNRREVLHKVERGWDGFTDIQKEKAASMNNFFCGLHYVVGLADQAAQTMNAWEKMIFGEACVREKKSESHQKVTRWEQKDSYEPFARPFKTEGVRISQGQGEKFRAIGPIQGE